MMYHDPGCAAMRRPWALECNRFAVGTAQISGRQMPQSLVQIYIHIVFSTKDRQPFLHDAKFRNRLHAYLNGVCENHHSPSLKIGGVDDHIHILSRLSKTLDVATLIRELKRDSSKWIKDENPELQEFYWQNGYGAFSISPSHVPALIEYIANQEEHHRTESFQDEYRRLCKKYGIEIDERYVWD
jgi:REP element-mobilizing transposase RayT